MRAATQGVDWAKFLKVVGRQRVPGLARDALRGAGAPPPADVERRLTQLAQAGAGRSLALAAEAVRLRRMLDAERAPALFIKGPALAQLAYGSQTLKSARDVDVLVAPSDVERVFELLKRDGYVPVPPVVDLSDTQMQLVLRLHKDLELSSAARGTNLELHWRLIDNPALLASIGVASPAQEVAVLDGSLRTLADAELFAYLSVHGASHCWFRLKWLADLNAWLAGKTNEEIVAFYRRAEQLGVDACAGQALRLANRLLGLRLPDALSASLRTRKLDMLVAMALDAMAGADGEVELTRRRFGPFRTLPAQFLRGRGLKFQLAQCRLMIENLDDMLMYPLPRALHFLYPLLRLPLWVMRVSRRRRPARAEGAGA
ncbi:MAG TPA: nucleotidyltransferase family protein [Caulobacteraceae bacterium]